MIILSDSQNMYQKIPKEKIVMSLDETYSMHEFCKRYFVKYNEKSLDISSMQY